MSWRQNSELSLKGLIQEIDLITSVALAGEFSSVTNRAFWIINQCKAAPLESRTDNKDLTMGKIWDLFDSQ